MLDKFENIKAGGFIRLLSKMTQQIDDEPTIRTDEGDWLLSIPKSLKKDFADNYWITLKPETAQYINGYEMVKATIITLKGGVKPTPSPYLYRECNIKVKTPMTGEEFKNFLNMDEIYEIDSVGNSWGVDGGYLDYDSEWFEDAYCWTTSDEIFPIKIISSQRSMLNWDKEPWGDLK